MTLSEAIKTYDVIVENGPIGTRLKYDFKIDNPGAAIDTEEGKHALGEIYRGDVKVAQDKGAPIILNASTYRASRNWLPEESRNDGDVKRINLASINFIKTVRDNYPNPKTPIFIGAPLGSIGDAYSVEVIPTIEAAQQYHSEQMRIFKEAGVDFVNVVTLPSVQEAIGIAKAAEAADIECTIGFGLDESGRLRDGTSLKEAIAKVDASVNKKPIGYLVTCTHASVISKIVEPVAEFSRLIGVQPNGSNLSSKDLDGKKEAVADEPKKFAEDLKELKDQLGLTIIGGCCGTTREHLGAIIETCQPSNASSKLPANC